MPSASELEDVLGYAITGHPHDVTKLLYRKIAQITRQVGFHAKIGISNHPHTRWVQAYRDRGWDRMYPLYKSSLVSEAREMEDHLIQWLADHCTSNGVNWNINRGGGGPAATAGPYYVYMVTAKRYAHISR